MTHLASNRKIKSKPSWNILMKCIQQLYSQVEGNEENGTIPFLDTLVKPEADNTLSITVYRKPIHTDQYLLWVRYHNLAAKYSVISTLTHRARTVCIRPDFLNKQINHLRKVLTKCKYLSGH